MPEVSEEQEVRDLPQMAEVSEGWKWEHSQKCRKCPKYGSVRTARRARSDRRTEVQELPEGPEEFVGRKCENFQMCRKFLKDGSVRTVRSAGSAYPVASC